MTRNSSFRYQELEPVAEIWVSMIKLNWVVDKQQMQKKWTKNDLIKVKRRNSQHNSESLLLKSSKLEPETMFMSMESKPWTMH